MSASPANASESDSGDLESQHLIPKPSLWKNRQVYCPNLVNGGCGLVMAITGIFLHINSTNSQERTAGIFFEGIGLTAVLISVASITISIYRSRIEGRVVY